MNRSFSILTAGALALTLTACVEPETRPSGSSYVSLDDLVGMRASNNDAVLQSRGFTNTGGYKTDNQSITLWWNANARQCVKVVTEEGRFKEYENIAEGNCL